MVYESSWFVVFFRVISINLCCSVPYVFARSSKMTASPLFFSFASHMIYVMTLVCSTQPATPGILPFWTKLSINSCLSRKIVRRLDCSDMNILHSTFNSEFVWNWLISEEICSSANIPSEIVRQSGTCALLQITFMNFHSRCANLGQYL